MELLESFVDVYEFFFIMEGSVFYFRGCFGFGDRLVILSDFGCCFRNSV